MDLLKKSRTSTRIVKATCDVDLVKAINFNQKLLISARHDRIVVDLSWFNKKAWKAGLEFVRNIKFGT